MIDHYDWAGGREAMLRFGPDTGPVVVLLLPLFEEHNRTRAFAVTMLRALGDLGIASVLPDLPGQGESPLPTEQATIEAWRQAFRSLLEGRLAVPPVHLASMRGSAMLDSEPGLKSAWRLAPVPGRAVLADLQRAEGVHGRTDWSGFGIDSPPANLAGNAISWPLFDALARDHALAAPPAPVRTVRLESDPAPADRKIAGAPLWRRAEPDNDPALATLLAQDLADWVRTCDG